MKHSDVHNDKFTINCLQKSNKVCEIITFM